MIGERISTRRSELGLTQFDLARIVGCTRETIADLERGARENPRLDLVKRLAKGLRVSSDWLIELSNRR